MVLNGPVRDALYRRECGGSGSSEFQSKKLLNCRSRRGFVRLFRSQHHVGKLVLVGAGWSAQISGEPGEVCDLDARGKREPAELRRQSEDERILEGAGQRENVEEVLATESRTLWVDPVYV